MKTLLITPPMTQLNTPYPATAYLTGFLREQGCLVSQRDLAIDMLLTMLSQTGLARIYDIVDERFTHIEDSELPDSIYHFFACYDDYRALVEPVIGFLQGRNPSLALRIVSRTFLPEGPRFTSLDDMESQVGDVMGWAFGEMGTQDKAKYLATLFIEDLVQVIHDGVDPHFEMSRYGETLAASNPSFDELYATLHGERHYTEEVMRSLVKEYLQEEQPDLVGVSIPFPGNMLAALQVGKFIKEYSPDTQIVFGGGYVNTELRSLKDPRVFEFVDFITLDAGERPLLTLIEYLQGKREKHALVRTYYCEEAKVRYINNTELKDFRHKEVGVPTYDGLPLDSYLSLCEMLNPMHRIWSDGRWNKLTVAHGCYWSKCTFCDLGLDYIGRYDEAGAEILVDRIEHLIQETGQTGFHFVDEAAPPKVLFALAQKLLERKLPITWWGNIRFEKTFTPERCQLLAQSGCIAVTGGLEVASDRLLALMQKGVTVEQVARVTKAFTDAGILVHAYLMYGFPSQTEEETLESLEYVRQLMLNECFQSAYWHRFSTTAHSPIGKSPEKFGIKLHVAKDVQFANNDIPFTDTVEADHDKLGKGLRKALYNYMHGIGLQEPVSFWFDEKVQLPDVADDFVSNALEFLS